MPQYKPWEKEFKKSKLITQHDKPQSDVLKFYRYLKKSEKIKLENLDVLDLGSGTGRNSNYLAGKNNRVVGMEISDTAIDTAKKRASKLGVEVKYLKHSIGEKYPFSKDSFDLVLDVFTSNSLTEKERDMYLLETNRILKKKGYFFVKALCKEGDKNAENLLKISPGQEKDSYFMKEMGLFERIFAKEDFIELYSKYFEILMLEKKTSRIPFNNQIYKRNFWIAYLKNK